MLSDNNVDDTQFAEYENSEFIPDRFDIMYRFISQSLRQTRCVETLGIEKQDWIVEVTQKFNLISIMNFVFREALSMFANRNQHEKSTEVEERMSGIEVRIDLLQPKRSLFND